MTLEGLLERLKDRERYGVDIVDVCRHEPHLAARVMFEQASKLEDREKRLADVRHAMEHAEEIGRMDHYAANTIKEAVKL